MTGYYPHQTQCADADADVLLLVAPTGSGKTNAALLRIVQSVTARLLYVLPYRSSMDAMQRRLEPYSDAESVGIQHGRAQQSLYRRFLSEGMTVQSAGREAAARLQLLRLHTYPIRVCSPYYLLRAVYQFKGFEALLADCWKAWVIVDEIHAYDPQRLAFILATLRFLRERFGVRLLIMTATLAPVIEAALHAALPDVQTIRAAAETFEAFQRHRLVLVPGMIDDHVLLGR